MKRAVIVILLVCFSPFVFAQFQASSRIIQFTPASQPSPINNQLNKKSPATYKPCGEDTLEYARYKATGLVGVSISDGYSLGQFFESPDTITVSGFNFYAWGLMNNNDSIAVYCHLYAASSDSLPTGNPIRSDTVYVDSTFGSGVLANMMHFAGWAPFETTDPYVLVVSTSDSERVAVVCNDYTSNDGLGENLASGSVGGTWYNALNLNISGTPLDCDIAIEPFVKYNIFNDFTFKDCYLTYDSVHFTNKSSPILFSRMYNRYEFFDLGRFCHRWDFGGGFFQYGLTQDASTVYTTSQNQDVRMISTIFQYRGNTQCYDTTFKQLHFQPNPIKFSGIPSTLCTGDSIRVQTGSNGIVKWFDEPFDTTPFYIGTYYDTPPLYESDTAYVRSYNEGCISIVARLELNVNEKPSITSTLDDSICINSLANLAAYSDISTVRWFLDSFNSTFVHQGNVLQVGPLQSDTVFFAQAYNDGCTSNGRVKVSALVSNDFAPNNPVTSNDTTICLLSGNIVLNAFASDTIRWFDVPSGGQPIMIGDSLQFTPDESGTSTVFVDAFNGTCASSRLAINIKVDHFETVVDEFQETCFGNTLVSDHSLLEGGLIWYDSDTNFFQDGKYLVVAEPGTYKYFIEPYMGNCKDTVLHQVILVIHSLPVIEVTENKGACRGSEGIVKLADNGAIFEWLYEAEPIGTGLSLTTSKLFLNRTYQIKASKNGCESDTSITVLILKMPNANFDYQISWRNVDFTARDQSLASYNWDMDDNGKTYTTSQFSHYFAFDGDYKVTMIGTGENGCIDTIFKPVTINTLSVKDIDYSHNIWPNPSTAIFNIELPDGYQTLAISAYDLSGRKIKAMVSKDQTNAVVDLHQFGPGSYFIRIMLDGKVYHAKVVKF